MSKGLLLLLLFLLLLFSCSWSFAIEGTPLSKGLLLLLMLLLRGDVQAGGSVEMVAAGVVAVVAIAAGCMGEKLLSAQWGQEGNTM